MNYYGNGCYNCGDGWGAAAAGAAVGVATGAAVGAAVASAATAAAYASPPPAYYSVLCFYQAAYRDYQCGNMWMLPAYGANGVYYQAVPPP